MCEFCLRHGEGEKWYLRAQNYADDLLSDVRRRRFVADFLSDPEGLRRDRDRLALLARAPGFVRRAVSWGVTRRMKKIHFGQVVPIEDVERIFSFVNSIVRVPCVCRLVNRGHERRYCYGLSLSPGGGELFRISESLDRTYLAGPDAGELESLTREEALRALREHEAEGLCHSVWTFVTPFIGAICNCDRSDCLAMIATVTHDVRVMFRAEYVAEVVPERCVGCRQCMRFCQFGALSYSAGTGKAVVDLRDCFGCGVCRAGCPTGALGLRDRSAVPAAARLW
ncbi:MAG: 4Fe-4S binding protein [Deltaproteobacteria bacterium]|nr:4Fe-4S binding protein [Deltaproteobacteria bacterium]